tara:strand:+ start:814 stop:1206 length:393 start_codon:yes stop_codon:yes gene_type:complete
MRLPKLYRKVYLAFEWCIDTCHFGEHHQSSGFYYIQAARVLDVKGGWFWNVTDWAEASDSDKKHFDKYDHHEDEGWAEVDWNRFDDDGELISYYYPHNRLTIKAQRKQREPSSKIINHNIDVDFDSDVPF